MNLRQPTSRQFAATWATLFLLGLVPLGKLTWGAYVEALGANPIEVITRSLGTWTLNFLLIALAVTPARHLTGLHWLTRLRRMFGLFAFLYVSLHLVTYLWLDQFFDWTAIAKDVVKRPFISAGFAAFVLLTPLAVTSNDAMVRRLGGRRWTQLHRSAYAAAIFGTLHYWWLVKKDVAVPLVYALLLGLLLGWRALRPLRERWRQLATHARTESR